MLVVVETHPIQYHAPVYRAVQARHGIPVTAIYGSDFSVRAYRDREFGSDVSWDGDLLDGYSQTFLSTGDVGEPDLARLSATGVREALARLRPAAILLVGYSPRFHRQAWRAAWWTRRPILFRGETLDDRGGGSPWRSLRRVALSAAYTSCARVLYIGERARRHYLACGVPESKLVRSPYCVDVTPFEPDEASRRRWRDETRRELGLADDAFVMLFVGKLSPRKGVDAIPDAIRMLPAELRHRAALVCLGDGILRDTLAEQVSARSAQVRCLGVRRQREMSRFYHAADLLVLPSRHGETWGLVVNEALHHGVPCVVSDRVGCAPDLIAERTGVVCAADSTRALADAIVAVQPSVGRPEIREACRRQVAPYSVEAAAAGLAEAYRAAVGEGASA